MPLIVTLLLFSLVSQCWTAPQRRNWTPQAILYLKGAQGHRSFLERTRREEEGAFQSGTHNQSSNGPGSSLVLSILLELLQRAVVEDAGNPNHYLNNQEVNITYL
ncbi:spexin-like [Archocentrus centrarchus]|uniref:spexin-like n=1 Tax=Archocentrus centrarchus TaxID=63155 RepID=UPI0011E9E8E9|nr:spexin-like [Archocentrus centrarchus]